MGFTLSNSISVKAAEIALSMGASEDAVVIPDTPGMVLVRQGSKAFQERTDNPVIFMIPVKLLKSLCTAPLRS